MVEKDFYPLINKYYQKHARETIVWEAKITKGKTISFNCLLPHQEENLLKAEDVFTYKIPDVGRALKPFDGFVVYGGTAVFIAIYYLPRKTEIYEILFRDFVNEKYKSEKKSLTIERAREIARAVIK